MVTNCKNCGLPIFHGIAGYAGPQCMCKLVTLPQMFDESMARIVALEAERDQLKAELTACLLARVQEQESISSRVEYNFLLADNERLDKDSDRLTLVADNALDERDTLRKQLDEARELLDLAMCKPYGRWDLLDKIDAWLEANTV